MPIRKSGGSKSQGQPGIPKSVGDRNNMSLLMKVLILCIIRTQHAVFTIRIKADFHLK